MTLCCKFISNNDVFQINIRFWDNENKVVASKIWKKTSDLGIRGEDDDKAYIS